MPYFFVPKRKGRKNGIREMVTEAVKQVPGMFGRGVPGDKGR